MAELSSSRLDGRRDKLRDARASAVAEGARVAKLDGELTANANQSAKLEAELMAARDLVAALKKSIKSSRKRKEKLRDRRKDARKGFAKAQQRATSAERRYDKAMLADMVAREKQHDLARHTTEQVAVTTAAATTQRTGVAKTGRSVTRATPRA